MAALPPIVIQTVFDNLPGPPNLKTGWGFSCWITAGDKTILFDTGADGPTLLANLATLKLDPANLDMIVLSHAHSDHTGGFDALLPKAPNAAVVVPMSFPEGIKRRARNHGHEVIEVSGPRELSPGIWTTGELGEAIREQSLAIVGKQGVAVVTGCAHPGIARVVETAESVTQQGVLLAVGGFHMQRQVRSQVRDAIAELVDSGIRRVAPSHCTGDWAKQRLQEVFGDGYIANCVGQRIEF